MTTLFSPTIRVRYEETDQMGVVYHGNYLNYFQVGRTELMRHLGFPYAELEARGILMPVVEAHCRYKAIARYDDVLRIETAGECPSALRVRFRYRAVREPDETLVADGWTELACLDRDHRPRRLPADVMDAIGSTTIAPRPAGMPPGAGSPSDVSPGGVQSGGAR